MSVAELIEHPERSALMQMAFTYRSGKNNGEFHREQNPSYQRQKRQMAEQLDAARK